MIHPMDENSRLDRLYGWLDYELSGGLLLLISFFFNFAFFVFLIIAILFTPYMLKILYQERKYGWILSFVLFVMGPSLLLFYLFGDIPRLGVYNALAGQQMLFSSVTIGLYVIYCYCLKISIR
jgi:hypothetical protein